MANNKKNKPLVNTTVSQSKRSNPKAGASTGRFTLEWKLALLLGVISFLVYANTLKNNFAMDDYVMITDNSYVAKGIKAIPELLSTPHQRGFHKIPNDEYRPLSLVLFAIEYQFAGLNPGVYHFFNLLLFAGCVVLLFRFLNRLFDGKRMAVAFVATLLFALHPLHTEVVANIKSGDELLCFLFAFLAVEMYMSYVSLGKQSKLVLGALCFLLAFLAKETVITFLAVIPFIFFFYKNENRKLSIHVCGSAVLVVVVFLAVRYAVLSHYHANELSKIDVIENALAKPGLSTESRLATAILMLGYYLKLLFVPYPLLVDYSFNTIPYVHFSSPLVLLTIAGYMFLIVLAIRLFMKDRKNPYAFGIFFFLVTIALFSNIVIPIKSTLGERLMFFPSVGMCLIVGLLFEKLAGKTSEDGWQMFRNKTVPGIIAVIGLVYAYMTYDRNAAWESNYTIYKTDINKAPNNCRLNYLLSYEVFSMSKHESNPALHQQMLGDAIVGFRRSLAIYPDYFYAASDLGAAYFLNNQSDSAVLYDLKALKLYPDATVARNNLSGAYMKLKAYQVNIDHCKESIRLSPGNGNAYADIGLSFNNLNLNDSAIYYLQKGIAAVPDFYGCYDVLAFVYHAKGNSDSAAKYKGMAKNLMGQN